MIFQYQALNSKGETVSDFIDAQSENAALGRIRALGLYPVKISHQKTTGGGAGIRSLFERISAEISTKFSARQSGLFSRQLATLLKAGMPLLTAINDIIEQIENKHFRNVITDIRDKLEEGSSFSSALARHSVFSEMYINMVRVGENLGSLDHVMERLAELSEKGNAIKSKVRSALYYPAFMLCFSVIIIIFLLVNVIPSIAEMFRSQQKDLPLPTKIVMGMSDFLAGYWFIIPVLVIAAIWFYRRYAASKKGQRKIDQIKLKIPLFGGLYRKMTVLRFTQNLGVLLVNKVDIIKSFEIVQKIVNNIIIEEKIEEAAKKVREGSSVSQSLGKSDFLPKMVLGMISAGESSDNLDNMLINIGRVYESELDLTISALTSLIEPLIIIFMGLIIGLIVISVMLPIMEMNMLVQ
ncbi:MAG: type II secretion system F family protein [Spirochaetia bacterium]|jgi:general secretion pathway protein F|nr:type II secretion system F family protein [Spirochaetia bacterium]